MLLSLVVTITTILGGQEEFSLSLIIFKQPLSHAISLKTKLLLVECSTLMRIQLHPWIPLLQYLTVSFLIVQPHQLVVPSRSLIQHWTSQYLLATSVFTTQSKEA